MPSIFDALRDLSREGQGFTQIPAPEDFDFGGKPRTDRGGGRTGLGDGEGNGDGDDNGGFTRTPKEPFDEDPFQLDIPDWLRKASEQGFGQEFLRSSQQLGGTPLSEQTNIATRGLREQSFLQGVSGSGFAGDKIRQLELNRGKALQKLQLGIESQNEATKRQALSQLKNIELFNEQVQRDFANMSEIEKLNQLQRQFQLQSAQKQFESQFQSTGTQLAGLGFSGGLALAGVPGFGGIGLGIAGLSGLFSLFG